MLQIGYALSSEEHAPNELVSCARRAEEAGFTFALISDHYHPWIDAQGHSAFVWSVIGGIAQATERLRLGTGVNLTEHILGDKWPVPDERLEMLEEAIEVIRLLWEGGYQTFRGDFFDVEQARLYTLPDEPPPIAVAASKSGAAEVAGRLGDALISVAPERELVEAYREA